MNRNPVFGTVTHLSLPVDPSCWGPHEQALHSTFGLWVDGRHHFVGMGSTITVDGRNVSVRELNDAFPVLWNRALVTIQFDPSYAAKDVVQFVTRT